MKPDLKPALQLICEFEGLYLKAYRCPAGVPTIGYGTIRYPDGDKVRLGDTCTEAEAYEWLLHEVEKMLPQIKEAVSVPLTNSQLCAIVSFCYNLGVGAFKGSTLLKILNNGKHRPAAGQFGRWVKANGKTLAGLVRRREAEKRLFLSELSG